MRYSGHFSIVPAGAYPGISPCASRPACAPRAVPLCACPTSFPFLVTSPCAANAGIVAFRSVLPAYGWNSPVPLPQSCWPSVFRPTCSVISITACLQAVPISHSPQAHLGLSARQVLAKALVRGTIAPSMVLSRARFGTALGTALGLTLASCAMDNASLPPSHVIAESNRNAAASITTPVNFTSIKPSAGYGVQIASLSPMLGQPDADAPGTGQPVSEISANPPVVRKGTVLWRLTGDESDLPPTPKMGEEIRHLRETVAQMQGKTTDLENQLQSSQASIAQVKDDQARQERDLRSQTSEAVANVSNLAQESMRSMERVTRSTADRWFATNQQLNSLEGRLQTAIADVQQRQLKSSESTQAYTDLKISQSQLETQLAAVREARQAAMEAELRAKSFTGQQLAGRDQAISSLMAANQSNQQLTATQMQALRDTTDAKLAAVQQVQTAQLAAVSTQVAANQQLTAMQLTELRKVSAENRALASSETSNVAAALRIYADTQLQQASASTSATIASLAQATNQSFAALSDQTNRRLGVLWQAANQNAEKMAEQKADSVAASVAALQQQTESQRLKPEQIRAIAEQTVADSTPEFRALALKTMQESQDYIRTIARTAVQDKDPAMQSALANAARDVITKDDRVVFAIRKAVAEQLQGVATDSASTAPDGTPVVPAVRLGPDHAAAAAGGMGEDGEQLDPNRVRIAQLLAPGSTQPATDSARMAATLAAISPAAGQVLQTSGTIPVGAGGQQSWSTPGTSLMRSRNRADWMDIRQYKVVVHEDDQTLEELLSKVLNRAEPFTGPWHIRWKISEQNKQVLEEKFSLDAETTFEEFVSYLAQYVVNDRGVKLSFSLFDNERIIVVSD